MSAATGFQSAALKALLDPRLRQTRRFFAEARRRLTFKPHRIEVFLQLDDPYSYLLSHYLQHLEVHYRKAEIVSHVCQSLRQEFMPEPALLAEYAVMDCTLLAREFGVPFLDKGETPAVEHRRALIDLLAYEEGEEDFNEIFLEALTCYWRGDVEGVTRLLGNTRPNQRDTEVLLARNQQRLRKLGHYSCATMLYAGEWYWGVDRLHHLTRRLDALGAARRNEPNEELAALEQAMQLRLPATVPARAMTLPTLELFFSFRSPYSYLALKRVFDIANAYGLKLEVKPVLPMVMRGLKVPKSKVLYILADAQREAERLGVPFGNVSDPLGKGVENCIAGYYYARAQKRDRLYLLAAGNAIFNEGTDVASEEGIRLVAERAGLFWPEFQAALRDDGWKAEVERNREQLSEMGLWGVPVFKLGGLALWGQDRDWLLSRQIEDLCHTGDGIMA